MAASESETLDSALGGKLRLYQPRDGYRFSVDPLLLADFVGDVEGEAVELGTGCGVLALALALKSSRARIAAIELQPRLAEFARRNVEMNGLAERVRVVKADLRALDGVVAAHAFDLVVANPPFQRAVGRISAMGEKAIARHEIESTLKDVLAASSRLLRDGGRFAVVYPAQRLIEVLVELPAVALAPRRLRLVHPRANEPARLMLLEAVRAPTAAFEVLPPLVLHGETGRTYSPEAARILAEPG